MKAKDKKNKNLSPKDYLDISRPYLSDMINGGKTQSKCKIQLTTQINVISSKDSEEMHRKSSNTEIMICNETDEIIEKLFDCLLQKYQDGLEESMRGSQFIRVNLLSYHLQKIGLKRGGSYKDSPEW